MNTGGKPFACTKCDKAFRSPIAYTRTTSPTCERQFACSKINRHSNWMKAILFVQMFYLSPNLSKQLTLFCSSLNLSATADFVLFVTKLIRNSWLCFVCHLIYQKQLTLFSLSPNLLAKAYFVLIVTKLIKNSWLFCLSPNLSEAADFVLFVTKLIRNSWFCFDCHQTDQKQLTLICYQQQLTLFCLSPNLSKTADFGLVVAILIRNSWLCFVFLWTYQQLNKQGKVSCFL